LPTESCNEWIRGHPSIFETIEHLILDDSISEIMVNGPDRVFIEKGDLLQRVQGVTLGEKSLMVAVKNIARRIGDDISTETPVLNSPGISLEIFRPLGCPPGWQPPN
jgi:Flp pilus assembly CpaF family ATPase